MKDISVIFQERAQNNSPNSKKIDYEFQQLGTEMVEHFGKKHSSRIWSHFHKAEYPISIIRESWFVYQKTNIRSIKYYFGILNNKAGIKKKR